MVKSLKKIEMYTDGACSGNPGPGGFGVLLMYKDTKKELSGFYSETTNNKMEMMAVIQGLEYLKEPCEVTVYSDSAYVVNSINQGWVYSWKKNNWKKSDGSIAKNFDLWDRMLDLMKIHNVKFIKVKGHSTNEYNNRCDKLATDEIKKNAK